MRNGQIDVLASRGDSPSLWDATLMNTRYRSGKT